MKNLVVLLILFIGTFAQAQENPKLDMTTKKSFIVGGSINYSKLKNTYPDEVLGYYDLILFGEGSEYTVLNFNPYFGMPISSHWVMGLQFKYQSFKVDYEDKSISDVASIKGIGVFGRYIFYPQSKFNLYLQPNFVVNKMASEYALSDNKYSYSAKYIETGCDIGFSYQVGKKVRLTANLGGFTLVKGTTLYDDPISETEETNSLSIFTTNMNLANTAFGVEINF